MKPLYQGSLKDLASGPDRVLPHLIESKATGHLMLVREGVDSNAQELVYLQGGYVVACSSMMLVPVRDVLLAQRLVTPEEVAAAEDAAAKDTRPGILAEHVLVKNGRLTMPQVLAAMAVGVRDACVAAMTAPAGAFIFKVADQVQPSRQLSRIPLAEVALAYGRAVSDPSEHLARILGAESVALEPGTLLDTHRSKLKLLPPEQKLLFGIDHTISVTDLRAALGVPAAEFDRLLLTAFCIAAVWVGGTHVEDSDTVALPSSGSGLGEIAAAARTAPAPASHLPEPPPAAAAPPPTAPAKRVLIVDDSPTIQEMVSDALRDMEPPLALELADDGMEAVRKATANRPDLVILDVVMPGIDGFQTCSQLRKLLPPEAPIIMLTSKDGTFSLLKGKLAGATNYITKPFEAEELRRIVREHLAVRK